MEDTSHIEAHLVALYGERMGRATHEQLRAKMRAFAVSHPRDSRPTALTERDAMLITYGDQVRQPGEAPLKTLAAFCDAHARGVVSAVHILPFYPFTSDDGFSVADYRAVNPALGDWGDVAAVGRNFDLMFDAVVNHVSASSEYVRGFVRDDAAFRDFAIVVDDPRDPRLSRVVRPRALPLLTKFDTASGEKFVWTTFSADQVDLNFKTPAVLLEILDVLLGYVAHGARFIRLDAIAFLWKELGTTCLHLSQTHRVIQLMRAVLDAVAPNVLLITETNVPHADNISYFGDGANEAQLVYNFALPPLVVHTLRTGDATALTNWARALALPSRQTTFFNFLASHDGIGLNPVRGILGDADIDVLAQGTLARGGLIGYKHNPDGSRSPYEMNINFLDAIARERPENSGAAEQRDSEHVELVQRMLAAHAIMLSLVGVPGIYFHSLFGSRGWREGVAKLGHNRAINRQKLDRDALEFELNDASSLRARVFAGLSGMLRARAANSAFDPHGEQRVLDLGRGVFGVARVSADGAIVVCLANVTDAPRSARLAMTHARDLLTSREIQTTDGQFKLDPFQAMWLVEAETA